MAVSIDWATKVITIPKADLVFISGTLYELDVNAFRLALKDIEDSEDGSAQPDTHRHNTQVVLSGVTYARTFEIINGYTVTFGTPSPVYTVRCVGANHNLADVCNFNGVSLIVGNSAGLQTVATGGSTAPTAGENATAVWAHDTAIDLVVKVLEQWRLHGLDPVYALQVTPTARTAGAVSQTIVEAGNTVTVTRQ